MTSNSDFTLPTDTMLRLVRINVFRQTINRALELIEQGDRPETHEDLVNTARDASRMAFELCMAGEMTEDTWKKRVATFQPYLPERKDYSRSAALQQELEAQHRLVR
ncbi:MAG: hypothetical protein ACHQTE_00310 [Candidatus Saccharimonadales bacterium]